MDEIEIQIFDEITNYKEKFGWFTIRQWIFIVLIGITVIPTYIFLPKLLGEDLTSYIILIEAAGIGFLGFVPVHNLPAEKIIPFWFRHYFIFHKPLEYMTTQEYKELKEQKKNKRHNKAVKEEKTTVEDVVTEPVKTTVPVSDEKQQTTSEQEKKPIEASTEPILTKKSKKQKLTKEEKALMKAKKKYGYLFKEEASIVVEPNVVQEQQHNKVVVPQKEATSKSEELNERFNTLSDEEKEVFLKLVGK